MRGDEKIFLVHGFGLERPGAVPLKPELLLHYKSVLHKVVRDNAANLFADLALFSMGGYGPDTSGRGRAGCWWWRR